MNIPSRQEALKLIHDMGMLEHIVAHSFQVRDVALLLTDHLKDRRIDLSRSLVEASALLHDITKTRSLETRENHAQTGFEFLFALGYPEVGDVVRQHVALDHYDDSKPVQEADVVNYADKRVLHDQVVSLRERKDYILQRYGTRPEYRQRILRLWKKTEKLEERLFNDLPFSPEELGRMIVSGDGDTGFQSLEQRVRP